MTFGTAFELEKETGSLKITMLAVLPKSKKGLKMLAKVATLEKQNHTVPEIMLILDISRRHAYRLIRQARQMKAKKRPESDRD